MNNTDRSTNICNTFSEKAEELENVKDEIHRLVKICSEIDPQDNLDFYYQIMERCYHIEGKMLGISQECQSILREILCRTRLQ